ncbi:MAG TPA: hypothetical protein VGI24_01230 [Solirubrobacteraceae bacterium]
MTGTFGAEVTPPEKLAAVDKLISPNPAIAEVEDEAGLKVKPALELEGKPAVLSGESALEPNEAGFTEIGVFEK